MPGNNTSWEDTIVALATPPGVGAIGVIRLSGKDAWAIAGRLFPSKDLLAQPSHTLHVGYLKAGDETIDEVVVGLYKGPRSYTGEDVVEISCHGSPYIQQQLIQACMAGGARLAGPGEFTQRAFFNGKLDLAQAEAVADLIASTTKASRDTALRAMRGGFSGALMRLRERLIRFSALVELELDFSQEDVEFADRGQLYQLVSEAQEVTRRLMDSFGYGNAIRNGVRVAIAGRPNAGKSTLLNNLLNEDRAIVSHIAGTTRDTVEEVLNIDGILFRLIDTAGIREHTEDIIERAGIDRTLQKIRDADIVLYLFDVQETDEQELRRVVGEFAAGDAKLLLVGNKTDINGVEYAKKKFGRLLRTDIMDESGETAGRGMRGKGEEEGGDVWKEDGGVQAGGGIGKENEDRSASLRDAGAVDRAVEGREDTGRGVSKEGEEKGADLAAAGGVAAEDGIVWISARDDEHLDVLKQRMFGMVIKEAINSGDTVVTNARHYQALKMVHDSLEEIKKGLDMRLPGDLLALDIRHCLHYLGGITGEITSKDQLDYIFGQFCIGK